MKKHNQTNLRSIQLLSILLLISAVILSGCTVTHHYMDVGRVADVQIAPLTKDQYKILSNVNGNGRATRVLFFGGGVKRLTNKAEKKAMEVAITSIPSADLLIAPHWEVNIQRGFVFFTTVNVSVKAKAVQIYTETMPESFSNNNSHPLPLLYRDWKFVGVVQNNGEIKNLNYILTLSFNNDGTFRSVKNLSEGGTKIQKGKFTIVGTGEIILFSPDDDKQFEGKILKLTNSELNLNVDGVNKLYYSK
ncbi:MAG: DUF6567 family protein [Bacteroidota bacterium]